MPSSQGWWGRRSTQLPRPPCGETPGSVASVPPQRRTAKSKREATPRLSGGGGGRPSGGCGAGLPGHSLPSASEMPGARAAAPGPPAGAGVPRPPLAATCQASCTPGVTAERLPRYSRRAQALVADQRDPSYRLTRSRTLVAPSPTSAALGEGPPRAWVPARLFPVYDPSPLQ